MVMTWKHAPSDVRCTYPIFLIMDLAFPPSPSLRVGYIVVCTYMVVHWHLAQALLFAYVDLFDPI